MNKFFWDQIKNKFLSFTNTNIKRLTEENNQLRAKNYQQTNELKDKRFERNLSVIGALLTGTGCLFGYKAIKKSPIDFAASEYAQYQLIKDKLDRLLQRKEITQTEYDIKIEQAHTAACKKCGVEVKIK